MSKKSIKFPEQVSSNTTILQDNSHAETQVSNQSLSHIFAELHCAQCLACRYFDFQVQGGNLGLFRGRRLCHLTHQCLTTAVDTDRQSGPQLCLWMIDHDGFTAAFLWRMVYFHWKHNCLWQEFWKRFYPKHYQKSILYHGRPLQVT